ncbi:hypothetical protein V6Z11_D12G042300 [Gossypium hirsutum]|uniref:Reverse transcriptase zinc-binding domain-containing protein n=2 Tax=Gossypium TaxID=3633 RepID=A0A5D2I506_GOSTO|nr:hypothetical protein ES288_D12G044600v1 [Gossypium darwinii]TYH37478.1 hypothetical protein ES332_D12G043300v1 [Gossypium tomentosum]
MNCPNLLVARVLKEKFYSTTDFIESGLGNQPSFLWRSIWADKGLLRMGCGWQMGNGSSISIWDDAWLPGEIPCKIQSERFSGFEKVVDLIGANSGEWNVELLRGLFSDQEVRKIMTIPLASRALEDRWWFPEEGGEYTIRRGYRLLLLGFPNSDDDRYNNVGQDIRRCYRQPWAANVPEKMKD